MNVCFNGCSFTVGEGFPVDQRENYIYDRILEQTLNFKRANIAVAGSSNYLIFMRSADAILSGDYDCVITQWTALNRLWLCPGPDATFSTNNDNVLDFKYNHIYLSPREKIKFKDTLLMLNGDYNNIIDLIKFCNILKNLSYTTKTKIIFINGLVPWTDDLNQPLGNDLNNSLSDYSKSLLDFDNKDDDEIIKFFLELEGHFAKLDQSLWVNLFDSWAKNCKDTGPEGHHPGIASHKWMADKVLTYLKTHKII